MDGNLNPKQVYNRTGWAYFLLMFISQVMGSALLLAANWLLPQALAANSWLVWAASYVPLYGVGMPLFFLLLMRTTPATPVPQADTPVTAGRWLRWFFLLLGATYILNLVSLGVNYLLTGQMVNTLGDVAQAAGYWPSVVAGCLVAPLGEEVLFRCALWRAVGRYGEKAYVLLGGVVFALFHGNLSQLLYAFFCGVVLCYVYVRTGKLWCVASLHVALNTVGIALAPLATQNLLAGLVLSAVVFGSMVAAVCILAVRARKTIWRPAAAPDTPARPVLQAMATPGMAAYTLLCGGIVVAMVLAYALA